MADDGAIIPSCQFYTSLLVIFLSFLSVPAWKARFGAEVVSYIVEGALTARAPKYSVILNLDRRIRNMELPKYSQGSPPQGARLAQTMEHFMPSFYRHLS